MHTFKLALELKCTLFMHVTDPVNNVHVYFIFLFFFKLTQNIKGDL